MFCGLHDRDVRRITFRVGPARRSIQGVSIKSNGQNRVHPEARWPTPGTPFHASPRAPSYWPTPAQTRLWTNLKRVPRPDPTLAEFGTGPPDSGYSSPHRLPDFNHTYPIMAGLFDPQPTRTRVIASSRDVAGLFCGRRGRACGRTLT